MENYLFDSYIPLACYVIAEKEVINNSSQVKSILQVSTNYTELL
jgi:hypothetical protein